MRRHGSVLLAAVFAASPHLLAASPLPDLIGRLEPKIVPRKNMYKSTVPLTALTAEELADLPVAPAAGDKAYGGKVGFPLAYHMRVVLVEPREGTPFLYVDHDRDGKLLAGERYSLPSGAEADKAIIVPMAAGPGPYATFPAELSRWPASKGLPPRAKGFADAFLMANVLGYLEGRVAIDGKEILVRYLTGPGFSGVNTLHGTFEMDVNGDGAIDSSPGSHEVNTAQDDLAIFRIGERYVSLRAFDPVQGTITLQQHDPSQYGRVDLRPGVMVPDFSFVDLEGNPHKLSDWRGRHVLLDFWATWCGPCIAQFPILRKAYEEYHARGFDIIGVVYSDQDDKARKFLEDPARRLPWRHATSASTEEVTQKRFRIQSIPVTILIDPQGRVVSGGKELEGVKLLEALARIWPARS